MGPRAGLDWCGKSHPTGIRSPYRPARRQSLYRLSYPAHLYITYILLNLVFNLIIILIVNRLDGNEFSLKKIRITPTRSYAA